MNLPKITFKIRLYPDGKLEDREGYAAQLPSAPNYKFVVHEETGQRWKVTELSTGCAVPGSFADTPEDSISAADASIVKFNKERTAFDVSVRHIKDSFSSPSSESPGERVSPE